MNVAAGFIYGIFTRMIDYQTWLTKTKSLPLTLSGQPVLSGNDVKVITLEDGTPMLLKIISPEQPYIPRIKILGEAAYSLFDYHLNPEGRVSPYVCPVSPDTLWRQFLPGLPGEIWRADLHLEQTDLDLVDAMIADRILESASAERIALLDLIFMCQDRSARNWITHGAMFYAVDNGMLWPYKCRFADKLTVKTGDVFHLMPPMDSVIAREPEFTFGCGIFSTLYAGSNISIDLLASLGKINWGVFLGELYAMIVSLGYSSVIMRDWRFERINERIQWLITRGRFPTPLEAHSYEWERLICHNSSDHHVWGLKWETENTETQ